MTNHALIHANQPEKICFVEKKKYPMQMPDQQEKEVLKVFY
jgi:hypothetical protein